MIGCLSNTISLICQSICRCVYMCLSVCRPIVYVSQYAFRIESSVYERFVVISTLTNAMLDHCFVD